MAERGELLKPRRGIYTYPLDLREHPAEAEGVDTATYGVASDQTAPSSYSAQTPVQAVEDVDMFAIAEEPDGKIAGASALSRRLSQTAHGSRD